MKLSVPAALSFFGLLSGLPHSAEAHSQEARTQTSVSYVAATGLPRWRDYDPAGDKKEAPWGSRTCKSNPENVPDTGVVRKYEWTVERTWAAPDGFGMCHCAILHSDRPVSHIFIVTLQNRNFSL
ncbi:hypothetical protein K456DRAFT_1081599 [Colletotrichum gloeosporioides 23]|nr:hypothetical protein K456DRAFT_1081599 [Colletotrichum gloeosporioides 23]